jgi:hypothetical protein
MNERIPYQGSPETRGAAPLEVFEDTSSDPPAGALPTARPEGRPRALPPAAPPTGSEVVPPGPKPESRAG